MNSTKLRLLPKAYDLDVGVELHGHEIFHAGGAWKGVPVRARVGVFDDVIEAVAARRSW
ncbi:MAG: hypothetical protein ACR2JX_02645 [Mycobacteriales bacterium]